MLRQKKFMKKSLLFGMMLLASSSMFAEEQVVTVGDLTKAIDNNKYPIYSYYECSSSEIVYSAEDLKDLPAGKITKIEFAVRGGQDLPTRLNVWVENTEDTQCADLANKKLQDVTKMTQVYTSAGKGYSFDERKLTKFEGATQENPAYLDFAFDTPFEYTGGGLRIVVESLSYYFCNAEFKFISDGSKVNDGSQLLNCGTIFDFSEDGMRTRTTMNERNFPIIKVTVDATSTGVEGPAVEEVKNVTYYNIYGQKVDADAKGLVISSDGKKFFRN